MYGALLTSDSSYRVYFLRGHGSVCDADVVEDISLIVGVKEETFLDSNQQLKVDFLNGLCDHRFERIVSLCYVIIEMLDTDCLD